MKLLTLHRRNTYIRYKHTICSWAAIFVLLATILTVILPFYFAFYLFNDIWSQYKIVYQHPDVKFQYKYIFVGEYIKSDDYGENPFETTVTTCSSFNYLNELFQDFSECSTIKVSFMWFLFNNFFSVWFKLCNLLILRYALIDGPLQFWDVDSDFDHQIDHMTFQVSEILLNCVRFYCVSKRSVIFHDFHS